MSKAQLYVYEVTKGLAAQLSTALLGHHIPGVWHTGVVCYGMEYFFGSGGIQSIRPGGTIVGAPDEIIELGETQLSHDVFHEYLFAIGNDAFRPEKYHLFDHNCNTFSNEVAQFLTGKTIPSHILDLPRNVANTPLGAMLKTFMDGMGDPMAGQSGSRSFSSHQHTAASSNSSSQRPIRAADQPTSRGRESARSDETSDSDSSLEPFIYQYDIDDCLKEIHSLFVDDNEDFQMLEQFVKNSCESSQNEADLNSIINCLGRAHRVLEESNDDKRYIAFVDCLAITNSKCKKNFLEDENAASLILNVIEAFKNHSSRSDSLISLLKYGTNLYSDIARRKCLIRAKEGVIQEINNKFRSQCVECLLDSDNQVVTEGAVFLAYNMCLTRMEEEAEIELASALLHWFNTADPDSTAGNRCVAAIKTLMKWNPQVKELAEMLIDIEKLKQ